MLPINFEQSQVLLFGKELTNGHRFGPDQRKISMKAFAGDKKNASKILCLLFYYLQMHSL